MRWTARFAIIPLLVAAVIPARQALAAYDVYLPIVNGRPPVTATPPVPGAPTRRPYPTAVPTLNMADVRHVGNPNDIDALAIDERRDAIWTIGRGAIVRWSGASGDAPVATVFSEYGGGAADIAVGDDGTVWVSYSHVEYALRRSPTGAWTRLAAPARMRDGLVRGDLFEQVAPDHEGGAWFGTENGAWRFMSGRAWEPARFGGLSLFWKVLHPVVAGNGDVWFGFENASSDDVPSGMVVRRADGRWENFNQRSTAPPLRSLRDFAVGGDGAVWAVEDEDDPDVAVLAPGAGAFASAELGDFAQTWWDAGVGPALRIAVDPAGRPWFASPTSLVVPQDSQARTWRAEPLHSQVQVIRDFALRLDASAWLATSEGVVRRSARGEYSLWMAPGLPAERARAVAVDAGGAWVATGAGLAHVQPGGRVATFTSEAQPQNDGITDVAIAPDGSVWMTTANSFIGRRDPQGDWEWFSGKDGLIDQTTGRLAIGRDGAVWCTNGLPMYSGAGEPARLSQRGINVRQRNGRWRVFTTDDGLPDLLGTSIIARRDGSVWVGFSAARADAPLARDRTNLTLFAPPATWMPVQVPAEVRTQAITALAEDTAGALWLLTANGLARLDTAGTWRTFQDEPAWRLSGSAIKAALAIDAGDNVYASNDGGVVRIRPDGSRANTTGLYGNDVTDAAIGPDGRVWLTMVYGGLVSFLAPLESR